MATNFTKTEESHLIHEKITLPAYSGRLLRTRLLKLLSENLASYNATIINGRAGVGKSTLASDFARDSGRAVSWYKVDAADSDLCVFCEYLLAGLKLQRFSIDPHSLLELTDTIESDRAELLAESLVFQLSKDKVDPLLIVIEDLHLVYDANWLVPLFRRLLPLLPADVHLLITCRSLPPAPLWRLRSKQMLRVIDEAELAFTLEETIALFKTYGLNEEHARAVWTQTSRRAAVISEFAATPGRAGRAVADRFLSIRHSGFNCMPTPDFQT